MNPWIIDKDHTAVLCSDMSAVGVSGPCGYKGDGSELLTQFRMYDDDGVLYYEGRSLEVGFEPLDDFGMPNAGCTGIKYMNDAGVWEIL